jgi:hypothetical protein
MCKYCVIPLTGGRQYAIDLYCQNKFHDIGMDGRMILKQILRKWGGRV